LPQPIRAGGCLQSVRRRHGSGCKRRQCSVRLFFIPGWWRWARNAA
jgi:hypothetical protein